MIIDGHIHISEQPPVDGTVSFKLADGSDLSVKLDEGADLSVNRLLRDMDECHVNQALVMAVAGLASNEFLSKVVKAYAKRFVGFAWVTNPRTNQSVEELEKAVNELGLKGLKLHPGLHTCRPRNSTTHKTSRRAQCSNLDSYLSMATRLFLQLSARTH